MKKYLLITAALLIAISVPANAEPGPSNGFWAVDNVQNCRVPEKIYAITVQSQYFPTRFRFENIATGSLDVEEFVAMGDGALMTETVQSVRAHGHGHAVGTQWMYYSLTSSLINVEHDGKHAYFIVKCDQ